MDATQPVKVIIQEFPVAGRSVWTLNAGGRASTHGTAEMALHALAQWSAASGEMRLEVQWLVATLSGKREYEALAMKVRAILQHARAAQVLKS